jgi:carbamoyltransferase
MRRNYVGLACSPHDPSIAVVNPEGELVFAEGLERPLQNKRAWYAPADHVLQIGKVIREHCDLELDFVAALSWSRSTGAVAAAIELALRALRDSFLLRGLGPAYLKESIACVLNALRASMSQTTRGLALQLQRDHPRTRVIRRYYEHHRAHAASAAFSSPFDEALCVVVDGFGQGHAMSAFEYRNGALTELRKHRGQVGASLGVLYSALCDACGFTTMAGEEWKVMGLAPYGKLDRSLYDLLRPMLRVEAGRLVAGKDHLERGKQLFALRRPPGVAALEYADLAHTGQRVFCEIYLELLNALAERKISQNLILTGGCALNSSATGLVRANTPFREVYVPCAPGDDGNSIGAAYLAYYEDHPDRRRRGAAPSSPYLGSRIEPEAVERLARFSGLRSETLEEDFLCERVARLLADGRIVGWVQGRAEFGPRALGNRSILADPRSERVKDTVNQRVKFREEFRPFAPSILREAGPAYFEDFQDSPYMERTLRFTELGKKSVPGVVHVDGTGRLQTVTATSNPRFYKLIQAFQRITGVPVLLNTSFNVMGKPIVHAVEDAAAVLMTTGLDVLVLENTIFEKTEGERAAPSRPRIQ